MVIMDIGFDTKPLPEPSRFQNILLTLPDVARSISKKDIRVVSAGDTLDGTVVIQVNEVTDPGDNDFDDISDDDPPRIVFVANPNEPLKVLEVKDVVRASGGEYIIGLVKGERGVHPDTLCGLFFNSSEGRCTRLNRIGLNLGENISNWERARDRVLHNAVSQQITDKIRS